MMLVPKDTKLHHYGPFIDDKLLKATLEELATLLCHTGLIFSSYFNDVSYPLMTIKVNYLKLVNRWREKYLAKMIQ